MDSHLVSVPSLGTLSTRGLSGGVLEDLGGKTDGALDAEVTVLGSVDEVGAELLEGLDVSRSEGDPDLVDLGGTSSTGLLVVLRVVHVVFLKRFVGE